MNAKELLDAGNLISAIERLNQDLRAHPADSRLRTFLFELLCFTGDYARAQRQLDVIAKQDTTTEVAAETYRQVLAAEQARTRVAMEGQLPVFLMEPPSFASLHLAALHQLREDKPAEARLLLEQAVQAQPTLSGKIDGQPFSDFSDGDPVIGPFLEAFIRERYVWIPFSQMTRITIAAPKRLRELLWARGAIQTIDGNVIESFLPVLYAGSSNHANDQVKLGRVTDWVDVGKGVMRGTGQRLFLIDSGEKAMLETREIEFSRVAD